jgi:hypothetical protein
MLAVAAAPVTPAACLASTLLTVHLQMQLVRIVIHN